MAEYAIGWDLDSTLFSTMHRRWLIPEIEAGRATWEDYSQLCVADEPVPGAVALARVIHAAGIPQYIISGRSECAFDLTLDCLERHDVPFDYLILRPDGAVGRPDDWKIEKLNELQAAGVRFAMYLEDWPPAAKNIMDKTGIPVLGVNPLDADAILVTRDNLAAALAKTHLKQWDLHHASVPGLADDIFAKLGGAF